ncbi:alanine--tRNA ligase [Nannocystaceae bacterium ST9]
MALSRPRDAHALRSTFLEFFAERGHRVVPSSPLVPFADPTLLFVNAGMVQFKDVFTGRDVRDYKRAASAQRCVRAGGKHNDLDNVGFTPRHHTLFEMLGNFSFGDYFKRDAIRWAWTLLTEVLELPASRLVVSVFNGEGDDAPYDQEAYDLWAELVPRDRIYAFPAKENFWQMGDTGPCGPCTEIHIYLDGDEAPPDARREGLWGPAYEDSRYMELWNLVFMQYEKRKLDDGTIVASKLPAPSVDTGAGLERLAAVLEGVRSNYETSLLAPLVECGKRLAGVEGHQGEHEASFRVIADHARATAFLIADGVFPDKGKREYVLRRIMRRAIRHGTKVGLDEPFFHTVCAEVVDRFGDAYPGLREAAATIAEVVHNEEEAFRRTLGRGLKMVMATLAELPADTKEFPLDPAAVLYDTHGFPIDLTRVIAVEHGLTLDEDAVAGRVKAIQAGGDQGFASGQDKIEDVYFALAQKLGASEFLGYAGTQGEGTLLAILHEGQSVERAGIGDEVELIFDRTPFYAESGGQAGDTGTIAFAHSDQGPGSDARVRVRDTSKPTGGLHVHHGQIERGAIRVGDRFTLSVDVERRDAIRRNHSATHLLHHALRDVLGKHVTQKGSLVAPDRLRFDFSHPRPVASEQIVAIEQIVNRLVLANAGTDTREMTLGDAKQAGAIGLFGEKYGEHVRVVTIAHDSVELCGGTHVGRAGDIGLFKVVSEGGVAQGVRRIEAVTGTGALDWVQHAAAIVERASAELGARDGEDLLVRLDKLQSELKAGSRKVAELERKLATGGGGGQDEVIEVAGVKLLVRKIGVADPKVMRDAADTLRDRLGSGVVVLAGEREGKAALLVAVTKDLAGGKVHAGKLIERLAPHVGGRGGGRPDLAQAGGPDPSGLDRAVADAAVQLAALLG